MLLGKTVNTNQFSVFPRLCWGACTLDGRGFSARNSNVTTHQVPVQSGPGSGDCSTPEKIFQFRERGNISVKMEPPVKESPSKSFKKSHSRNLEQTDLILDFLSSLDKSKTSAWVPWQEEINQINEDWFRRMDDVKAERNSSGHHSNHLHLSPSKRVSWSEKLTNTKPVTGPGGTKQTEMFFNLSGKQVKNCFSPKTESEQALRHPQQSEHLYSERLKCDNFHHKVGPKLTIMSVLTENL